MFLFTISDELRSDHPFGFLQDGNFHKGGRVAAQLEHPLGCSCVGTSALNSAANFANTEKSSPMPCPLHPRGMRGCHGAGRMLHAVGSGTAGCVLHRLSS